MAPFWIGMFFGTLLGCNGAIILLGLLLSAKRRDDDPLPPQPHPWPKPRPKEHDDWALATRALGLDDDGRVVTGRRS